MRAGGFIDGNAAELLFVSSPIGILRFDAAGILVACNEAFANVVSLGREHLLGSTLDQVSDPALRAAVSAVLGGKRASLEGHYRIAGGRTIHVRIGLLPVTAPSGQPDGGVGFVEDLTAEHGAQRAAGLAERNFQLLAAAVSDAVVVLRQDSVLFENAAAKALRARGVPLGAQQLEPREAELLERARRAPPETWEPLPGRTSTVASEDGAPLTLTRRWCPLQLDEAAASLLVARESGSVSSVGDQLAHAGRLVALGELAAGVAHEVNNPLAYVLGSLGLLESALGRLGRGQGLGSGELEQAVECLRNVREGVDRVQRIVKDLQTFSRPRAEERQLVSVEQVLDAAVSIAAHEVHHRARLEKRYGRVPLVLADEARLGQVFLNLLMNALQALSEREEHEPEAPPALIRLTTREERGRVVVEVEDTGPGVAEAQAQRIFQPFVTTKPRGMGLGLAICEGIVRSFGGDIGVQRRAEGGACFRVCLPAAEAQAAEPEVAPVEPATRAARRQRLLIIDDEPLLGRTLRIALGGQHEIVTVLSGQEAIARLEQDHAFDVVLCDLMMPQMSGLAVLSWVRREIPALEARFVFMTGGAFTASTRAFLSEYSGAVLEKPFDIAAVERLLERAAPR